MIPATHASLDRMRYTGSYKGFNEILPWDAGRMSCTKGRSGQKFADFWTMRMIHMSPTEHNVPVVSTNYEADHSMHPIVLASLHFRPR